jgi:hypothetical protein
MKNFIAGIIFTLALCGTVVLASPAMREVVFGVRVSLNGAEISFAADSQPFIMNGRTFLPIREIANSLGVNVFFHDGVVHLTDSTVRGEWRGSVYLNDFFGVNFTRPSVEWITHRQIEMHNGAVNERFIVHGIDSPNGAWVNFAFEHIPDEMNVITYIDAMINNTYIAGRDVDFNYETITIGNNEWHIFQTTMQMNILGIENVYGKYFVRVQNGVARIISIITSDASETADEILQMFNVV